VQDVRELRIAASTAQLEAFVMRVSRGEKQHATVSEQEFLEFMR
jgi:hypothetical protein